MVLAIGTPNVSLVWSTPLLAVTTESTSYSVALTVTNTSTGGLPVTISNINTIATNAADFTLNDIHRCIGTTLSGTNNACMVTWLYNPQSPGNKSLVATVEYNNTSSTSTQQTSLAQAAPLGINWTVDLPSGSFAVDSASTPTSKIITVTYSNSNAAQLTFTPVLTFTSDGTSDTSTDFVFSSASAPCVNPASGASTLLANSSCTFSYTYQPQTSGAKQASANATVNGTPVGAVLSNTSHAVIYTENALPIYPSFTTSIINPYGLTLSGSTLFYTARITGGTYFICKYTTNQSYVCINPTYPGTATPHGMTGIAYDTNNANLYVQFPPYLTSNVETPTSFGLLETPTNFTPSPPSGLTTNPVVSGTNAGSGLVNSANGLAMDGDGNLWQLAQYNPANASTTTDSVDMLDVSSGALRSMRIGILGQSNGPYGITLGPDGVTMWFTLEDGLNSGNVGYNLGEISVSDDVILPYSIPGYYPRALVSDSTSVWVTVYGQFGKGLLLQISPSTGSILSSIIFNPVAVPMQSQPNAIAYDSTNQVFWIAETVYTTSSSGVIASSNIYRVDPAQPAGEQVAVYPISAQADPHSIVVIPTMNTVYFTEYGTNKIGEFIY